MSSSCVSGSGSRTTLRIVQVTDVYLLQNFPALRTLLLQKKNELQKECGAGACTLSTLTGDFLMPYLLSSLDKGRGMMQMCNETPIDILTWGNHECDLAHEHVLAREKEYKGIFLNTNFKEHESYANSTCQKDAHVVELVSEDGTNRRRVGLIGLITDSPSLYKPDSFGGKASAIEDPYETCRRYVQAMKSADYPGGACDVVVPLEHLYEPQDEKMANEVPGLPVILSGHDHHVVDKVVNGTRILKPGADAHHAVVLDLSWPSAGDDVTVQVSAEILKVSDFEPDPHLVPLVEKAYQPLEGLLQTQIVKIPECVRPLTSLGARNRRVSAGTFLLSALRDALNSGGKSRNVDAVLIKGGNVRGGRDYADTDLFTLESLKSEISETQDLVICSVPGSVIRVGLRETWEAPNPGWMQYDDGVEVDDDGYVTTVAGEDLDENRLYRVGTVVDLFRARDGSSFGHYFEEHPEHKPDDDSGVNMHALLLGYFADQAWQKVLDALDADHSGSISAQELKAVDTNGDGFVDKGELVEALVKLGGFKATHDELSFIDQVLAVAGDVDRDGRLSLNEINGMLSSRRASSLRIAEAPAPISG